MKNREFKDILRDLRTEHELSQKELAKRLGVSGSTISMYERGERRPEFDMLDLTIPYAKPTIAYPFIVLRVKIA